MESITRKSDLRIILSKAPKGESTVELEKLVEYLCSTALNHKIKFPLLEFIAEELFTHLPKHKHLIFCDLIFSKNTMGGLVIIGKILQLRLNVNAIESINKATHYISLADEWFICDIIGERVYGYGMRYYTETCFKTVKSIFTHTNRWVLRGMGAGCHFAIKRGLEENNVEQLFIELLKFGKSKDKEIRQGVGWACKTTAKFHPKLIQTHINHIEDDALIDNWVRRKIKMGLDRSKYVKDKNGE